MQSATLRFAAVLVAFAIVAGCGDPKQLGRSLVPPTGPVVRTPAPDGSVEQARVATLSLGAFHSCALSHAGMMRCWGANTNGKLGINGPPAGPELVRLGEARDVPGVDPLVGIAAGLTSTCAWLAGGRVRCWGLWKPAPNSRLVPASDTISFAGDVAQVDVGVGNACAVFRSGEMRCWGSGARGQLGYGNTNDVGDDEIIGRVGPVPAGGSVKRVAIGNAFSCALMESGSVKCWGDAPNGYPGTANVGLTETPASIGDLQLGGATVLDVSVGAGHACALLRGGSVRCWGMGANGRLGIPGANHPARNPGTPLVEVDLGGKVTQLSAGGSHTCAVLEGGRLRCWGNSEYGQLGYGNVSNIGDDETPAVAGDVDVGGQVAFVEAGGGHTCAMLKDGCVRCWGLGEDGQLGYDGNANVGDDEVPASMPCLKIF